MRKHEMIYVFYEKIPLYDISSHNHKFINTRVAHKDELPQWPIRKQPGHLIKNTPNNNNNHHYHYGNTTTNTYIIVIIIIITVIEGLQGFGSCPNGPY